MKKISDKIAIFFRFIYLSFILLKALLYLAFLSILKSLKLVGSTTDSWGIVLTLLLEKSGPTFIKIGQVLSSRPDIVGEGIAKQLRRLQCQVKPIPTEKAMGIVESSFGKPLKEAFTEFSMLPLACGSVAQVHLAVLNGQPVALKIQRPNLQQKMKQDFAILSFTSRLMEALPKFRNLPVQELLLELESSIMAQLDFEQEIRHSEEFRLNFADHTYIYIPTPIVKYCSKSVIVMEYMYQLNDCSFAELPQANKKELTTSGLKMLYKMIFTDGFIHADLHKGNIYFTAQGILLLDFGLTARLSPASRSEFRELFFAMATNNGNVCAEVIRNAARSLPLDFDSAAFTKAMTARLNQFSGKAVNDFEVVRFVSMLFDIQREFGIRSSTDFTMAIISLLMFEGVLKELTPELDFQEEAIGFLLSLKESAYTQKQRTSVFADLQERWNTSISSSQTASSIQLFFLYLSTLLSAA